MSDNLFAKKYAEYLAKRERGEIPPPPTDLYEMTQRSAERFNNSAGNLNERDGFNCPECQNRGSFMFAVKTEQTTYSMHRPCRCMKTRKSIARMKASGLQNTVRECRLENFKTQERWQKAILIAAKEFLEQPNGWFFIGGQNGSGKTYICTAIARELLLRGRELRYMPWREDSAKLKQSNSADSGEDYQELMSDYKNADVLYIDDLFKQPRGEKTKESPKPSAADINLAFELLNHRYNKPNALTLISCEWCLPELFEIDEAIAGRISERCGENAVNIARDTEKDQRRKKGTTL